MTGGRSRQPGQLIGANTGVLIGRPSTKPTQFATRRRPGARRFPFARPVETPGSHQSPYPPHQIYNLRHVPPGGLVEDRVGGGYFRKP